MIISANLQRGVFLMLIHLDKFLHGKHLSSGFEYVNVVHRLHAQPQVESSECALNAFAEVDTRAAVGPQKCELTSGEGGRGRCC